MFSKVSNILYANLILSWHFVDCDFDGFLLMGLLSFDFNDFWEVIALVHSKLNLSATSSDFDEGEIGS